MAQCVDLFQVEHGGRRYNVPCGKCYNCKRKRVSGWAFRLMNKDMHTCMSFFITLTYDTEHLMFSKNGFPTLYPNHLQLFWKVFRKRFKPKTIKYYACGEYGSNRQRPHYHAIVFVDDQNVTPIQFINWLEADWKHGSTHVGYVSAQSVAYTLKYISKPPRVS